MKIVIASDLHISKKIKRIDQVLSLAENADILCMTGDIVNDGVSEQFMRVKEVIEQADENSFRKPILTVCGNHDYLLEKVTCREDKENFVKEFPDRDAYPYPVFEKWLEERNANLGIRYERDERGSGSYAVKYGEITFIGLNVISPGRKFDLNEGKQIDWLEEYLKNSNAKIHIILAHTPLFKHNAHALKKGGPYIVGNKKSKGDTGDKKLQQIIDHHKGTIIFISGHTHQSPNIGTGNVQMDEINQNIYIDAGSVCPTDLDLAAGEVAPKEWKGGNITELTINEHEVEIEMKMLWGKKIPKGCCKISIDRDMKFD